MANAEHLAILKQGVEVWNRWREENPKVIPDLSNTELTDAKLNNANFDAANLSGSDLTAADLSFSNLNEADFERVDMTSAILNMTELYSCNLNNARLRNATLLGLGFIRTGLARADFSQPFLAWSTFHNADLDQVDFTRVNMFATTFALVDLSSAIGLETVFHQGPSSISIDTITRSKGRIPEVFLRGCGVPEPIITFSMSLAGRPIEFFSCFISHSGMDKRFCERLYADLQGHGVRVWYFPEDANWGEPVWGEIDRGIKVYDKLIVVCSEHSLTSGPVQREIERALQREDREGRNVLFPIRIDDYIFTKWKHPRKADVVAKVVGDFGGWDTDVTKYETALQKLLKALKAES